MAFHLIGDKLPSIVQSLLNLPPKKFWIHETVIGRELKLHRGPSHGVYDVTSELVRCIGKGYGGNKVKNTHVMTGIGCLDLMNDSNGSRVAVHFFGRKEPFARGTVNETTIQRRPRWFLIGSEEERGGHVTCEVQAKLVAEMQGTGDSVPIEDRDRCKQC